MGKKTERGMVRLDSYFTPEERALIGRAANLDDRSLNNWVRRVCLLAARAQLRAAGLPDLQVAGQVKLPPATPPVP